jgi:hypothetical protein
VNHTDSTMLPMLLLLMLAQLQVRSAMDVPRSTHSRQKRRRKTSSV